MKKQKKNVLAVVTAVYPNKIIIEIENLTAFKETTDKALEDLKIGSYLEVSDNMGCKLIAVIESYKIELKERTNPESGKKKTYRAYVLEATPLGSIESGKFMRGGDALAIPPTEVKPASHEDIKLIYENGFEPKEKFLFARLSQDCKIEVPVNGNKFFNKHFAIVGSSGSGKSHTIAKILQNAISLKNGNYVLNNSHVVIFDIHNEYNSAFPGANQINISNLILPYWLMNSEELEELFLESGDRNNYNQASVLRELVIENKRQTNNSPESNIYFDSPLKFNLKQILNALKNYSIETKNAKSSANRYMIKEDSLYELLKDGKTNENSGIELSKTERLEKYYSGIQEFHSPKSQSIKKGEYADGTLDKFISRLENKINDSRLEFLLGEKSENISFEETLKQFIGYQEGKKSNVTVIDLSGIPFEVLSITVSLISRILFDFGYFYKKFLNNESSLDTPLLLVYEEAHKYVPRTDLAKYNASRFAIERIAKEGRKYGVTLGIVSQRPSEISETIFSQCNTFIAMRLTNPSDQSYVKRLLPDALGNLIENLPALQSGEGLLLGESVIMPSLVKIDRCDDNKQPSSNDIKYLETWKEKWKEVSFDKIVNEWKK